MENIQEAKKRLLFNVGSNFLFVIVNISVGIWLVPFLIKNLGVALYGIVPLVVSITNYFIIFNGKVSV